MFIISRLAEKNAILKKLKHKRFLWKRTKKIKNAQRCGRVMFLCGVPNHMNMGDHAQTYCTCKLLRMNFPDCSVIELTSAELLYNDSQLIVWLAGHLRQEDKIVIQSGYNTTDLYLNEENMHRAILQHIKSHPITILPQTIYFQSNEELQKSSCIYNRHPQVKLYCRDQESYLTAHKYFANTEPELLPDIVTSEIGNRSSSNIRNGVLLCLRNDKERFYQNDDFDEMRNMLSQFGRVDTTDTTLKLDLDYIRTHRKEVLEDIWDEYSTYQVIITDRYHGLIFGLIANTPVVVLQTTDHKLSSGIKWFPDQFRQFVFMASDLTHACGLATDIIKNHRPDEALPDYFLQKYYGDFKKIVKD